MPHTSETRSSVSEQWQKTDHAIVRGAPGFPHSRYGSVKAALMVDRLHLHKRNILASPDFNRWFVPPASIAIHLCIGSIGVCSTRP